MLEKKKILLTATGAPGCSTLIRHLKDNGERELEIVATDASQESIGRFWADKFYQVPAANDPGYIPAIVDIIKAESPDLYFPVSSAEVVPVSRNLPVFEELGIPVVVSDPEAIDVANNKYKLYSTLQANGIPVPEFRNPRSLDEFVSAVKDLGYPERKLCFKPHVSKGSRGFRILDDTISRRDLLLNYKPESRYMSLKEFIEIFEPEEDFPELMVMELVEDTEYDAMVLCIRGDALLTTVKTREQSRWGIITHGELVHNPEILDLCQAIASAVPLSYNAGFQFIGNKLIEINPRVSTFVYQSDLNEPYLSIKLCLGETSPDELRAYQSRIRVGRRMLRYMDQIFWDKDSAEFED